MFVISTLILMLCSMTQGFQSCDWLRYSYKLLSAESLKMLQEMVSYRRCFVYISLTNCLKIQVFAGLSEITGTLAYIRNVAY